MTDEEFIGKHIEVEKSLCEAVKKAKANAKSEVLQALEDVRAEIHETGILDHHSDKIEVALAYAKVETIIDNKIKEIKHESV